MRRFLCLSLCLGLMVSACKKKSVEDSVNKAIAKAGAGAGAGSGGGDGGGGDGATTVTKKDKATVLGECLTEINSKLKLEWEESEVSAFFLRRNTKWKPTQVDPLVVLYVQEGLPLEFHQDSFGLGRTEADVKTNLAAMAASKVIQDQFVAREDKAPGWRVHISLANTDQAIAASANGKAPVAPEANSGIIIYDRENVVLENEEVPQIAATETELDANNGEAIGGWFECVVDDKTQKVTMEYTSIQLD